MKSRFFAVSAAALVLCACAPETTDPKTGMAAADIVRPDYALPEAEPFDAASVPAYAGDHAAVYAHIDQNLDSHIAEIQRWLRQPSVSAQNIGVRDMAEMLRSDLEAIGFAETAIVETDGHPGVWGFYDAGAERTLMLYMMYDVQPVNEEWFLSTGFSPHGVPKSCSIASA